MLSKNVSHQSLFFLFLNVDKQIKIILEKKLCKTLQNSYLYFNHIWSLDQNVLILDISLTSCVINRWKTDNVGTNSSILYIHFFNKQKMY